MSEQLVVIKLNETLEPSKQDYILTPLDIATLYFDPETSVFDVDSFVESYKEEYGKDIQEDELDFIGQVLQQYRRKDNDYV